MRTGCSHLTSAVVAKNYPIAGIFHIPIIGREKIQHGQGTAKHASPPSARIPNPLLICTVQAKRQCLEE